MLAALVFLLVVASRRFGPPRLYMSRTVALWVVALLFGAIILWLALD